MRKFVVAAILVGIGGFLIPEPARTLVGLGIAACTLLICVVTIVRS